MGLRSYLPDEDPRKPFEIGLEATIEEYVARMVEIFAEVRRVLRPDATLFLNLGDAYANNASTSRMRRAEQGNGSGAFHIPSDERLEARRQRPNRLTNLKSSGLKHKDLIGLPWRVAFALQEDGWWLRSDIIWHKLNPMPESVLDRPTRAHEYIFLLSRSARYYYDAAAIREPLAAKTYTTFGSKHRAQGNDGLGRVKSDNWGRTVGERAPKVWKTPAGWDTSVGEGGHGSIHRDERAQKTERTERSDKQRGHARRHAGFNDRWDAMSKEQQQSLGANKRDVWSLGTYAYPGAHFATFPPRLIEPCILAGCPSGGLVLDPFMGAGTTGVVARRHSRHYLGIELSERYCEMAEARIAEERQPVLWTA
jgi:DNA modification methylase